VGVAGRRWRNTGTYSHEVPGYGKRDWQLYGGACDQVQ